MLFAEFFAGCQLLLGLHAVFLLMPDGTDRQFVLGDAERLLGLGESWTYRQGLEGPVEGVRTCQRLGGEHRRGSRRQCTI